MWYVEVLVADPTYHKDEPLTYSSQTELKPGQIVIVPLKNNRVLGLIVAVVSKPRFNVKPIISAPHMPPLPAALIDLLTWIRQYYPAPLGLTVQMFLPKMLGGQAPVVTPAGATNSTDLPSLTKDQAAVLNQVKPGDFYILHGDTGSGKTRVYIELAKQTLENSRSALILTPEIGLTSQLAKNFKETFGERVVVVHSGLKDSERRMAWQTILESKEPLIVIGPRSALFSPFTNLGLVVVDESHEPAYKQEQAPHYQAAMVAAKLARLTGSTLILGSATPLITDYYTAEAKGWTILRMKQLAVGTPNQHELSVKIVDLKDKKQFSRSNYLSEELLEEMEKVFNKGEQALLFLNRRGTARVVFCENCAWQAICPHCDLPLVYHGDLHLMLCHSCSYKSAAPNACPACQNASVVFRSVGTKAIAEEVKRLFKKARVMRFDNDNKKSERLEANYADVHQGDVDVIVGTQTLAKGLDLPKLGLIGIVLADTGLYFPDFSAQERTFQLLSQALGRIGRGHRHSTAIIQTYNPGSQLLKFVVSRDWQAFYQAEIDERRKFGFPPFCYVLKLSCKRATSAGARRAAESLATKLKATNKVVIEGPSPSFHEKIQGKFVWQLIIKSKRRAELISIIQQLPSGWTYDIDPINLL